jgi:hypothetical protein
MDNNTTASDEIQSIFQKRGLSKKQQGEIFLKLQAAIMLHFANRLENELNPNQKILLNDLPVEKIEDIFKFYEKIFTREKLQEELRDSTREIMGNFFSRI